jgi:hypothetical protein
MTNTYDLAAELAARAHCAPDAAVRLARCAGPPSQQTLVAPALTGTHAVAVAKLSARWAIATITACTHPDTLRQLLDSERRVTVLDAACSNPHLPGDVVESLMHWAINAGRYEKFWELMNQPDLALDRAVQLSDESGIDEIMRYRRTWRLNRQRFSPADVRYAIHHGDHTLAAGALAAVIDRYHAVADEAYRVETITTVAARDDVCEVVASALAYDYEHAWDAEAAGPLGPAILKAPRRGAVKFTDEAITMLWDHALSYDNTYARRIAITYLPASTRALEAVLELNDPALADAAARKLVPSDDPHEQAIRADLAARFAEQLDHTVSGRHRESSIALMRFPLTPTGQANALRGANHDLTVRWLSGIYDDNLPSGAVVADLVARPGSASQHMMFSRDGDVPFTAALLYEAAPHPGSEGPYQDAIAQLPGALKSTGFAMRRASVDALAEALAEAQASTEAWALAAELGATWSGTVAELVDIVLTTS